LANIGQLSVVLGEPDLAEATLRQVLTTATEYWKLRIAALDSLAQLRLLQGRLDEAAQHLDATAADPVRSWYQLATYPTRIRLALKQDDPDRALALVSDATGAAQTQGDSLAAALLRVLRADALVASGRLDEAATALSAALRGSPGMPLASLAELERVHGKVVAAHDDPQAALPHFDRAVRILMTTGHVSARADAVATRTTAPGRAADTRQATGPVLSPATRQGLDHAARLVDMAGQPELLGRETFALLEASRCARWLALVASRDGDATETLLSAGIPPRHLPPDDGVTIPVGSLRGRTLAVHLEVAPDFAAEHTVWSVRRLVETAHALETARRAEKERTSLWPADIEPDATRGVFVSPPMIELVQSARQLAENTWPILITGETGTGKEVLAREIHRASPRAARPMQPFNCSAVAKDTLDSQLFGHRRGAFTGAIDDFPGVIRAAAGSTLFLDEIGELSLEVQPKLLRFLDTREVHPLGQPFPEIADVRIVAATNANLDRLVSEGRFREDLFYRLNIFRLHLPPLRQRREEIPALVHHFLAAYCSELGKPALRVSDEALECLILYKWPGNVRQLANEMRRLAAVMPSTGTVDAADLADDIRAARQAPASPRALAPNECLVRTDQPLAAAVRQLEGIMIERALARQQGHVERAARQLGISRKGLFLKRKRLAV
jgi:DNA-binding NtrC family response regulator